MLAKTIQQDKKRKSLRILDILINEETEEDAFLFYLKESEIEKDIKLIESELLHKAIENGRHKIFNHFLDLGVDPNSLNSEEYSLLEISMGEGNPTLFRALIERGATPTRESLKYCLQNYNHDMKYVCEKIIDGLDSINIPENINIFDHGDLPLFVAIHYGSIEACRLLLKKGADPNLLYQFNNPCSLAINYAQFDILKMLVEEFGASITYTETEDTPCLLKHALFLSPIEESMKIFSYLISNGLDINHKHNENDTLINSILNGEELVAKRVIFPRLERILKLGLKIETKRNPLIKALELIDFDYFKLFVENGVDINSIHYHSDDYETSPAPLFRQCNGLDILQISTRRVMNSTEYIHLLIKNGVTITSKHIDYVVNNPSYLDHKKYFLLISEKRRRDQLILMDILLSRRRFFYKKGGDDSYIFGKLPLPLLKYILNLAEIPFVFPPRENERIMLKRLKTDYY